MNDIIEAQEQIDRATIYSELRLLDFTEEEIQEMKYMNHSTEYLKTYLEIAQSNTKEAYKEYDKELGVNRNAD